MPENYAQRPLSCLRWRFGCSVARNQSRCPAHASEAMYACAPPNDWPVQNSVAQSLVRRGGMPVLYQSLPVLYQSLYQSLSS